VLIIRPAFIRFSGESRTVTGKCREERHFLLRLSDQWLLQQEPADQEEIEKKLNVLITIR
jgi:hypothetical protein